MKKPKIVTQRKGKYRQKILTWQEDGKPQRLNIPKALWYLIDEAINVNEILRALEDYKKTRQPRQRKSDRRVKGEGSGLIRQRICTRKNKDGSTKKYVQHWFQYRKNGKLKSKYIPVAMVENIIELNVRKVPIFVILNRLD